MMTIPKHEVQSIAVAGQQVTVIGNWQQATVKWVRPEEMIRPRM
jgi:hypothetical protein